MIGFVDDCCQRVNRFRAHPQPTAEQLIRIMKQDAQLWNDLLWSSGVALEISKCLFQLIETDWTGRGRQFLKGHLQAPPLIISNDEGHITVRQTSNYHARRTLGVYLSPSGNMKKQAEILLEKSKKYAEMALTNILSRQEAQMFYHGIYIPMITYPLTVTNLTIQQCHTIATPFMKAILPRCGYNRSMHRAIRYAPVQHGGAGFLDLYTEQSIRTILMVLRHLRCPETQPGCMAFIAVTWAQAYAGVLWSLWQHPDRQIPTIPNPWIEEVRKALAKMQAAIIIANDHIQPTLCRHDEHIMDIAIYSRKFNKSEIDDINAYRRYYQATTIADIADDLGVKIQLEVWEGTGNQDPQDYSVEFFNQARPEAPVRRTWKRFLRHVASPSRRLYKPLSNWKIPYDRCRRRPQWVFHEDSQALYCRKEGSQYVPCQRINNNRFRKPDLTSPVLSHLPPLSYPVAVVDFGPFVHVLQNFDTKAPPQRPRTTFHEFVVSVEPWEVQLLEHTEVIEAPHRTAELLNEGAILFLSSDGSVKEQTFGSYGFTITHVQSQRRLVLGKGPAPGASPSSFRAEAYGVLAVARFLLRLEEFTGITIRQRIRHWIDNQSVLERLSQMVNQKYSWASATLQPDWDVVKEATETIKQLQQLHTMDKKPSGFKSGPNGTHSSGSAQL